MACSICDDDGHNSRTCPVARRCGNCNGIGHYATTCALPSVCRLCDAEGHRANECVASERDGEDETNPIDDIAPPPQLHSIPLPRGRRIGDLDGHDGWISRWALLDDDWNDVISTEIAATPRYRSLRPAFKRIVAAIHKASRHTLYIGRTEPSAAGLSRRFVDHIGWRGADWIRPLVVAPVEIARDGEWETLAIKWMKVQEQRGRLCCNNTVLGSSGRWPPESDVLIYLVAATNL